MNTLNLVFVEFKKSLFLLGLIFIKFEYTNDYVYIYIKDNSLSFI